jgi:glycosyltransferase involved in cell wall biosynthesis
LEIFQRYIFTVHNNIDKDLSGSLKGKLVSCWYKWILKKNKNVYAVCQELSNSLLQKNITSGVVMNTTDWKFLPSFESKSYLNVVMIGRLDVQKDFFSGFRLLKYLSGTLRIPIKVDVYGEGPDLKELEKLAEDMSDIEIKFCGYSEELEEELEKASYDILLLSSVYEGFGLVILEALYKGIYPIVRDCPYGPSELIELGVGTLVPYAFREEDFTELESHICNWLELDESLKIKKLQTIKNHVERNWYEGWKQLELYR